MCRNVYQESNINIRSIRSQASRSQNSAARGPGRRREETGAQQRPWWLKSVTTNTGLFSRYSRPSGPQQEHPDTSLPQLSTCNKRSDWSPGPEMWIMIGSVISGVTLLSNISQRYKGSSQRGRRGYSKYPLGVVISGWCDNMSGPGDLRPPVSVQSIDTGGGHEACKYLLLATQKTNYCHIGDNIV